MSILKNRRKNDAKRPLKKSDIDFYKMTGVFAIACIFVLLVLNMESTSMLSAASGENLTFNFYRVLSSTWFAVLGVIALAACVGWFVYSKKKAVDESGRIFTSTNCLALALYLLVFALCFGTNKASGMHGFFITFTVICAVVYYVSKIYNADFTLFSVITAVNVLAVYLLVYRFSALYVIVKLALIAASVAAIVLVDKKIKGMKLSKKRRDSYLIFPSYVSAALGAVFMFVRFLTTLPSYYAAGLSEDAHGVPAFVLNISNLATSVDMNVMFMVFLVEYIVFAIIYTLRLIRD